MPYANEPCGAKKISKDAEEMAMKIADSIAGFPPSDQIDIMDIAIDKIANNFRSERERINANFEYINSQIERLSQIMKSK
jgi:archaellum component FlaC